MPYEFPHHQANTAARSGDRHDHRPRGGSPHRDRRVVGIVALLLILGVGAWLMTYEADPPPPAGSTES